MTKRLFVALPLDKKFERLFSKYRDGHGRIPYLRWIPERNLHLTVLFIGNVEECHIPKLKEELARVAKGSEPLALVLDQVMYAPPISNGIKHPPTMVWARFKDSEAYSELVKNVLAAVEQAVPLVLDSHKQNGRDLIPHVTLARFKEKKEPPRELRKLHKTEHEGSAMGIKELDLMESTLNKNGAEYSVLERYVLSANV